MSTAEVGRRRALIFALVVALVFGAIAVNSWWSSREKLREGSEVIATGGEPMEIGEIPTTYRAVFRFENRAGGKLVVTTEKMWVRRPFSARVETYQGARASGRPETVRVSVFGALTNDSRGSMPLNISVPPSLASGDIRPDVIIEEALESRSLFIREKRKVLGRKCQVYRAGSSMLAGDLPRFDAGSGDYADVCIDEHGIILEEYWVQDDKLIRRRVATSLEVGVPLDKELFRVDVPETPDIKRGAVQRISGEPSGEGLPIWTLPKTPRGFDKLGRYAVVISADAVPNPTGGPPPPPPSSTADVYVRGPDLVVIDQDPSLQGVVGFEGRPTKDIKLDKLKNGKLIVDARMTEVRGQTGDGSIVRIYGTLPSEELIALANRLRPQES